MSRNQLAHLSVIENILPIPGMDKIEGIFLKDKNWKLFAQKGRFSIGETVIHVEPGAFLPDQEFYSFLGKDNYKVLGNTKGYLVRTKVTKNKEVFSEGILFKLEEHFLSFKDLGNGDVLFWNDKPTHWALDDILKIYNFGKLESTSLFNTGKNGTFPSWKIPYTDMPRFQQMSNEQLSFFLQKPLAVRRKYDGETLHIVWDNQELSVLSNDQTDFQSQYTFEHKISLRWLYVMDNLIPKKLKKLERNLDIQCELIGYNIAGKPIHGSGRYLDRGLKAIVFNIWDLDKKEPLTHTQLYEFVQKLHLDGWDNIELAEPLSLDLSIDENPILYHNFKELSDIKDFLFKMKSYHKNDEGIVISTADNKHKFKYVFNE